MRFGIFIEEGGGDEKVGCGVWDEGIPCDLTGG
jgi:hypothetical protein